MLGNDETDIDRARGLEAGADDYMVRPFSPIELLSRCNALLRRAKQPVAGAPAVSFGHLTIDLGTRQVSIDGEPVALTPIEYRLLAELARNGGLTVSNDDLLEKVWGVEYRSDLSLVKTYVYRLRTKLRVVHGTDLIHNERGFGYRLLQEGTTRAAEVVQATAVAAAS